MVEKEPIYRLHFSTTKGGAVHFDPNFFWGGGLALLICVWKRHMLKKMLNEDEEFQNIL